MQDPQQQTQAWLRDVVIAHGFCPFARREFESGRVRFAVLEQDDIARLLEQLAEEFQLLDEQPAVETSLLIFTAALADFGDYLDFLDLAQALLVDQSCEGVYQLASFHPDYQFADSDPDDPGNFTNRSPWPVIQVLREESISAAVDAWPDPEAIPEHNVALARARGGTYWQSLLEAIRRQPG